MAKKRKAPAPLSFELPGAKRPRFSDERVRQAMDVRNAPRRPNTGATIGMPTRGGIERTADRLAAFGVPRAVTEGAKTLDRELLGFDVSAQSLRDILNDNATTEDYVNAALLTPLAGLATRPVEALAKRGVRGLSNVGRRALNTRAGRFMTEVRPLVDEDTMAAAFSARPVAQRRITDQRPVVRGLPAPEQRLGLPAPGPGLPSFAVKPKGGQWWVDKNIGAIGPQEIGAKIGRLPDDVAPERPWFASYEGAGTRFFDTEDEARAMVQREVDRWNANRSPENAARKIADMSLGLSPDADGPLSQLQNWFLRAAPRYIKNEMGTPEDPMRELAERGALHVALSPDEWSEAARSALRSEPIGDVIGLNQIHGTPGALPGAGYDFGASVKVNMPWLTKAPVTDKLYGIADTGALRDRMGFDDILQGMRDAVDPRAGLPASLAVRPESLDRMSLASAAERVNAINQFRAKEREMAARAAMESPALSVFKQYPDDPRGMRWVELKAPEMAELPEGYTVTSRAGPNGDFFQVIDPTGEDIVGTGWSAEEAIKDAVPTAQRGPLQQALKYEGDTMGICVGDPEQPYCDNVLSGASRIFSLRDAKGEPHVTIETKKAGSMPYDVSREIETRVWDEANAQGFDTSREWERFLDTRRKELSAEWQSQQPRRIVQIKGKQNLAPKEDYLPFVQDFVKSGQWSEIRDFENAGLIRLPDGRYITAQQAEEAFSKINEARPDDWDVPPYARDLPSVFAANPHVWGKLKPYFEGYARGGRALAAKPCSCDKSLSVR